MLENEGNSKEKRRCTSVESVQLGDWKRDEKRDTGQSMRSCRVTKLKIGKVAQGRNQRWIKREKERNREKRLLSRRRFDWTREGRRFHELFYGPATTMGCPRNPHTSMCRGREISPFPRFSLIELVLSASSSTFRGPRWREATDSNQLLILYRVISSHNFIFTTNEVNLRLIFPKRRYIEYSKKNRGFFILVK